MRTQDGKNLFLGVLLIVSIFACTKDNSSEPNQNDIVKRYLEFKTKMSAFNESFGQMSNFLDVIGASQLHESSLKLKALLRDSVYNDSIPVDTSGYWDNWTCATVTEFDNNDGTHTTIYDYGEGCDEFGYLTKGKITYVWKNIGNNYYSKVLYENYYCYGTEMNGFSEYSFTSDGNSYVDYDTTGVVGDSANISKIYFNWSGSSICRDSFTMIYDTGEAYIYSSNFSTKWENSNYTVLQGEFNYQSYPEGYNYHYLVSSPLIYDYDCPNVWVAISGIESIHYNDLTKTYDFIINYGNGECDNIATITENGETSQIDFSDLLYIYCGTDSIVCQNGSIRH